MDLSKALRSTLWVERCGYGFHVEVTYEKLPPYCSHCRAVGHSRVACRAGKGRLNAKRVEAGEGRIVNLHTHLDNVSVPVVRQNVLLVPNEVDGGRQEVDGCLNDVDEVGDESEEGKEERECVNNVHAVDVAGSGHCVALDEAVANKSFEVNPFEGEFAERNVHGSVELMGSAAVAPFKIVDRECDLIVKN